jgi:hypothetical protein
MKPLSIFNTILFFLLGSFSLSAQNAKVFEEWATPDGTQNFFSRASVMTDGSGNVYVAGATLNGSGDYDLLVSKYSGNGVLLWNDQYDGTGNGDDFATSLVVDELGNVFVTGSTFTSSADTSDVITLMYEDDGTQVWAEVFSGAADGYDAGTTLIAVSDTVFVGGIVTGDTTFRII